MYQYVSIYINLYQYIHTNKKNAIREDGVSVFEN